MSGPSYSRIRERFWNRVQEDPSGCWIWRGALTTSGYGNLIVNGRPVLAHRFAYAEMCAEIPDGLVIDHLCRVPACVNPYHLDPVTIGVNTRRGLCGATTTARFRQQTHCKRGHPLSGDNVHITALGYRVCRTCQREWANAHRVPTGRAPDGQPLDRTHCARGHEYTPENTRVPVGTLQRICRKCDAEDARRRYRAKREEVTA